ncbi:MAG: hypothetical protein Kow00128_12060 [Deltaproteobacteria bacterium]
MNRILTRYVLLLGVALLLLYPGIALGAKQAVALFPPDAGADHAISDLSARMGKVLQEKLSDRFEIALLDAEGGRSRAEQRRKARSLGAAYMLLGNLVRLGRSITLDLTLTPTEGTTPGTTVVATAEDGGKAGGSGSTGGEEGLPFVYRRLAIEATAKLKRRFFGDGIVGEGSSRRKIPELSGSVRRSRGIPGDMVSIARGDTDRDGTDEIVAAYRNAVVVYRNDGADLVEKARIDLMGDGMIHLDVADLNRNGIAEIVAVRYVAGKSFSDILEYDGKQYRKVAGDIPYFLRVVDLGPEGIVLVGQESDPAGIFAGPIFRLLVKRYGTGEVLKKGTSLPMPEGSFLYSFVPLRHGREIRYAEVGEGNRLRLFDATGTLLWEGIDAIFGTETTLDAPVASGAGPGGQPLHRRIRLPGRLLAADLDGDGNDELVLANNLVRAGTFFENLDIYANAELLCYAQTGSALSLAWRTTEVGSPALDLFLERSSGGGIARVGVASPDEGKILGRFGEWRILWVQ